jgi:hypothetical protein
LNVLKRLSFAIELAAALFIPSAIAGLLWSPLTHMKLNEILLVVSFPAIASIGVVVAALIADVFPPGRLTFPVNLTGPAIHTALLILTMKLALTTPSALQALPSNLTPLGVWQHWQLLAACFLFEVSLLSGTVSVAASRTTAATINETALPADGKGRG